MSSNFDLTVGSVSDSVTRIPIGFLQMVGSGIEFIDLGSEAHHFLGKL